MMLFIHRQYAPLEARAGGRARTSSCAPPHREERVVVPIPGSTGRSSRRSTSGARSSDDVRAVFITDDARRRGQPSGPTSSARSRASRWSSSSRRTARSSGRCSPTSTSSTRPGRRTRRRRSRSSSSPSTSPALVGADPLQPVGQAAADGPARAAAHGRRRRPVPARGPGPVRGGARRRAERGPAARPGDAARPRQPGPPSLTVARVPVVS